METIFDSISPVEYRYLDFPEADRVRSFLSEQAFIRYLARVEAALVQAYVMEGLCSAEIYEAVAKAAKEIEAAEVYREEKRTRHQLRALVHCLAQKAGPEAGRWIHLGATSHDMVCTADALRYREFCRNMLVPELMDLEKAIIDLAMREKDTPQIGRTHGQHAVPITFGFALAEYVSRLGGRIESIYNCAENLRGQFSGAVGAYNAQCLIVRDPIAFEAKFLQLLELQAGDHSTQIVEPEYTLDLLHATVSAFGVLANLADDMRHLQRSEIDEVAEQFDASQVGSSTMPHKRNPINFEHVKSLWKTFAPRILTAYLDQISEHQRDLTNSASSRFSGEILCGLYLAARRMRKTMERLTLDRTALEENLEKNWDRARAEPCYTILALNGHPDAHEAVREAVQSGRDPAQFLAGALGRELTGREQEVLSDPRHYLGRSAVKTEAVCRVWQDKLQRIKDNLQ